MTTKASERCPERVPVITENKIENELVLFDPRSDAAHVLNPTAALVWYFCDGTLSPTGIAEEVAKLFEEAPPTLSDDVTKTIKEFMAAGIVRWK